MNSDEISEFLKQLTLDLHYGRKSRRQVAYELTHQLFASDMANSESFGDENDLNQAIYWDLLHLVDEHGFETESEVIEYYVECLEGRRSYSGQDRDNYLKERWKK